MYESEKLHIEYIITLKKKISNVCKANSHPVKNCPDKEKIITPKNWKAEIENNSNKKIIRPNNGEVQELIKALQMRYIQKMTIIIVNRITIYNLIFVKIIMYYRIKNIKNMLNDLLKRIKLKG